MGSARKTIKLPFLPGYSSSASTAPAPGNYNSCAESYFGVEAFGSVSATVPKLDLKALEELCKPGKRYNNKVPLGHDERAAMKESARNTYRPAIPPAWLKHDRQVLRFAAYFQEPVFENPQETFRMRHCNIYFYLEDGTIMVSEPRVDNSGMNQGVLVKRHRISKPDGTPYGFQDLLTMPSVVMYARTYSLYDCDEFTREFGRNRIGVEYVTKEGPLADTFQQAKVEEAQRAQKPPSREELENREYVELAIGGSRKNRKLQQYLENDRKVLRFQAFWDDQTHYGLRNYFIVHYYLSEDSVEILEDLPRNSGRHPYPVFWRRSPLRRNPHVSPAPGMPEPEPDLYRPEDLAVGRTIDVYGREIYLYDCDEFTRDFYRGYMGLEQESLEIQAPEQVHPQLRHPPHTGFGTAEDALASCLHLTPRPPPQDLKRVMKDEGKALRFEGRMVSGITEDDGRRFVIAISLADDTVGVWEQKQRNSGHASGKFSSRSRKRNPTTKDWYRPADFHIGTTIEINAVPFELVGADDATVKYMEDNGVSFPVADKKRILGALRPAADVIRGHVAADGNEDEVPIHELALAAASCGVTLCKHELLTLARSYGKQDGFEAAGVVNMRSLAAALR